MIDKSFRLTPDSGESEPPFEVSGRAAPDRSSDEWLGVSIDSHRSEGAPRQLTPPLLSLWRLAERLAPIRPDADEAPTRKAPRRTSLQPVAEAAPLA